MHTFNQYTRPSDYLGNPSFKKEKYIFNEGSLTKSIKQGNVFIGDEFNISSEDCMKAIVPALELKFNKDIIIPGIENKISISDDFFFIICQNTKEISGRRELPERIKTKIKVVEYPERVIKEIEDICEEMWRNKFISNGRKSLLTKDDARKCGTFMMLLNEEVSLRALTPWSLRDISKLFSRIYKQTLNESKYNKGLTIEVHILFYILSSTDPSLI